MNCITSSAVRLAQVWLAASVALAQPPTIGNCSVFPANNIWNTPIDRLPVSPNSSTYINTIGAGLHMHADFGSGLYAGGPIGIPYITVPGSQTKYPATFLYFDESDPGPYAVPLNAPIEGGSQSNGDRHTMAVDVDNCILYELGKAYPQTASWQADAGAIFGLLSNVLRPVTWTSTDAAGLSVLAGLARYDEIVSGEIRHALRFTAPQTQRAFVWPARHYASSITDPTYPPMGLRVRLRASYDISGFSSTNQIILRALKKYGMMLADNGSAWYVSGAPDSRWDNNDLHQLGLIAGSDFEVVDVSPLMVSADSGQARQGGPVVLTSKLGTYHSTGAVFVLDANNNYSWDGAPPDKLFNWGTANLNPGYQVVVGDWNGSGTQKVGLFDPASATWLLDYDGDGIYTPGVDKILRWGSPGDTPVVGDWNGSGTTKVGTFGPNTGLWLLDYNGNFAWDGPSVDRYFSWGSPGDTPLVGDWNGTGTIKVGTFGPRTGFWLLDYNGNFRWDGPSVDKYFSWGSPGDTPLVGDWSGSGTAKVGTFVPGTGLWLLDYNGNFTWDGPGVDKYLRWGSPGDTPVIGDWNGSGTAKVGTFVPGTATWLLDFNGNFTWDGAAIDKYIPWGSPGDTPVVWK